MAHIAIFLKILAIPFGVVALIQVFQAYGKYKHKYLQIYGYLVGFTFLIVVLSLSLFYIFSNMFPRIYSQLAIVVETVYCILTSLALILISYLYVLLSRHLLQKEESGIFKRIFSVTVGLLTAVVLFFSFYSISTANVWPISHVAVALIVLGNWFNIGVIITMLLGSRNLPDKGKQTVVKRFSTVIVIPYFLTMAMFMLHVLGYLDTYVSNVVMFFYQMTLSLLPILYLKRFMEMYHGVLEVIVPDKEEQLAKLFKKYNISKREREIIQLICEGKTNKQIEDHLFISILTVKEHISKIYKKTGVKNRVRLNNLFRGSESQLFSSNRDE